jgi:hypothetical protein
MLVIADSLEWLKEQKEQAFTCACFSPPYAATPHLFDARVDFAPNGRFIPYALELSRVCDLWAVNFGQLVEQGHLLPFTEELVISLRDHGVFLFDRWIMTKNSCRPYRGNRALVNFEFVLLFSRQPTSIPHPQVLSYTTFQQEHGGRRSWEVSEWKRQHNVPTRHLRYTPYSEVIPRQVFSAYAGVDRPVLDPFCGSGTTLLVAKELGLEYVGVDIDPVNIQICQEWGLS